MNKATLTKEEKNKKTNNVLIPIVLVLLAILLIVIPSNIGGSHSNIEQWLLLNIENN